MRLLSFFFPDLELFFWKSARYNEIWIFLPFWQNMLLGWLKNNSKCYGALKTGVWRCTTWIFFFDLFWPVFDLFTYNLTGFLPCQKNLGGSVRKKKILTKSDSSHAKRDIKAKKSTHFVKYTPLKSRKCLLAKVELFFRLTIFIFRNKKSLSKKQLLFSF